MIFTYLFIIGVAFGVFYPVLPAYQVLFWTVVVVLSIGFIGVLWLKKIDRAPGKSSTYLTVIFYLFLVLIAFSVGWGRYSLSLGHLYPDHVSEYLSENFDQFRVVEGRVTAAPEIYDDKVRLRISPTRIWLSPDMEEERQVRHGDIQLQLQPFYETGVDYEEFTQNKIYGNLLRVTGSIVEPPDRANPRGFSYREYLNNHGIYGNMWFADRIEVIEESAGNPFVSWALSLQEDMLKTIKMTMPYPQSAFLGGATLGLRHGLEYTTCAFSDCEQLISEEFRGAGTMHVLAVSGLHVGVIAAAFWALFAGLRIPPRIYVPLIIICLIIFTIITGARPATVRAAIMTSLMLLAFAFLNQGLRNSVIIGISVAALLILLYHPRYVFEASFTLSFAAVLCLALISGPADQILQKLSGLSFILFWVVAALTVILLIFYWNFMLTWYVYLPYIAFWALIFWYARKIDRQYIIAGEIGFLDVPGPLRSFIAMQLAIQLGMMWPLSAYYFQEYPFAGIFANFFAIPLVSVVVPLGLFAGLLGLIPGIGPWIALVLNAGNYLAVTFFLWVSHIAVRIFPYPAVRQFTPWHLLIFYGALAVFIWWDSVYEILKRLWFALSARFFDVAPLTPRAAVYTFVGIFALCLFLISGLFYPTPDEFRMTLLDVGYGEAVAVQTPAGTNMLFNAGARKWDWHHRDGLADRWDDGRRTVAPFFLNQGIKTLDLLALQSVQPQRSGGMAYIAEQFVVRRAMGPLPEEIIAPRGAGLTPGRFISALQDEHYSRNARQDWFENDFYNNWERWWKQLQRNNIPYERPHRGQLVYSETNRTATGPVEFKLYALNPPENPQFSDNGADNQSLVFRIEYGDRSFLLPGDIRAEAQQEIIGLSPEFVRADVLVVPGNGIRESSYNEDFVAAVDPDYVVLSSSDRIQLRRTRWGTIVNNFSDMVEQTWRDYSARFPASRLFYTERDNAVIFKSDGIKIDVEAFGRQNGAAASIDADVSQTGW